MKTAKLGLATAALMLSAALALAQETKVVAISTIVEVPALMMAKQGILDGLAERGYVEGKTMTLLYENANGSMPTQQQIAKKFMGQAPDVIIPITTPTSQAMIASTSGIPIVFAMVTDPVKAQLVPQLTKPGGHVTGVSDAEPIGPQLDLMQDMVPGLKHLGFIYNPGLDNALATLEVLKVEAAARGIEIVESAAPTTNEVIIATRRLVGKVEALYVPNDATVTVALESIVKVGQDTGMPVFAGETSAVARGAAGSVGLDYRAVGRSAGLMAADVLDGKNPGDIDVVVAYALFDQLETVINKGSSEKMGMTVPQAVLDRADKVIE
ncbi:MAG: ABC transporter substrate-binding protein [Paracoccaceae bacterium]|nr:ABC transporter substrate-binding protein [Paracoccaceae bacterium]